MPEHTFLVGIGSEGENREAAELALSGVLVPLLKSRDEASPIECFWIAEDDRHDGSDTDSAVFVPLGRQAEAQSLLEASELLGTGRELWVVETTFNTDPEGKPAEEWDDSNRTLHGPFPSEEAAQHFMDEVWPDGDTDVREQVAFPLNSPSSLRGGS